MKIKKIKFNLSQFNIFVLLMFSLMFFTGLSNVYSTSELVIACCYNADRGIEMEVFQKADDVFNNGCKIGDLFLGNDDENFCDSYKSKRLGCQIGTICYGTVSGKQIYDFPIVKNSFNVNLNSFCSGGLIEYHSSCTGNTNPISTPTGPTEPDYSGGGSTVGEDIDIKDYDATQTEGQEQREFKFCVDSTGPFGLFSSQSCNNVNYTSGGHTIFPCLFNPYLSGYIGYIPSIELIINPLEASCIPKTRIESCFDYKTKENCEDNPVWNDFKKNELKSCRWVDTTQYFDGFEINSGICISNQTSDENHFIANEYTFRQNLLENPGFEDGNVWSGNFDMISNKIDAYDGYNYVRINEYNSISQNVTGLGSNVAYEMIMHIRGNKSFNDNHKVQIMITEYNDSAYNTTTYERYLLEWNLNMDGVFKRVPFGQHVVSRGTNKIKFNITTNTDIFIDSVVFARTGTGSGTEIFNPGLFKPLEIITANASICELCFDKNNLNLCTFEKSSLLGDCSYMVVDVNKSYTSSLDDYLGKDENVFRLEPWKSQSIANANLFCELYVHNNGENSLENQGKCENPYNYVNSKYGPLHFMAGNTLCKWDDTFGCFKDSGNSDGPDTIKGGEIFLKAMDISVNGYSPGFFYEYNFKTEDNLSDFAYGCDTIPPQSYIYFKAINASKDEFYVTDVFPEQTLGNIYIGIDAYDLISESCNSFDIEKKLYVDYVVNDKAFYRQKIGNLFNDWMPIKDFFVNRTHMLLDEGENNVTIIVKDQSGNIGKVREFTFDVDLYGPQIIKTSNIPLVFGPNPVLNLTIDDKSGVEWCNFTLIPFGNVNSKFYNASGNLFDGNYSNVTGDLKSYDVSFNIPIFNTTDNTNLYLLDITCSDIFAQQSEEKFQLFVNFDTSFILLDPRDYQDYTFDYGFLNTNTTLHAVSVDKNLKSCEFESSDDVIGDFKIENILSGFDVSGFSDKFYSNITGWFDFESDGKKNLTITCDDIYNNEHSKNYVFYYDTNEPVLLNYTLESEYLANNVIELEGVYYVINNNLDKVLLNLTVDGTGSWISKNNLNLTYEFNELTNLSITSTKFDMILKNDSFVGNIYAKNFFSLGSYGGINTTENNLYNMTYKIDFSDKAGNLNFGLVSFYFDNSNPHIKVSGDVLMNGNDLYSNEKNPLLNVSFATPAYRTFNCNSKVTWKGKTYIEDLIIGSNIEFRLGSFINDFDLNSDNAVLDLKCTDLYGRVITKNFNLIYDNISPILKKVYLDGGNVIYLPNDGSNVYEMITDKIVFDFEDTNERGYSCHYSIGSSNDYDCRENYLKSDFTVVANKLVYKTGFIDLLSENNEAICHLNKSKLNLEVHRFDKTNLDTKINIKTQCFDKANLTTGIHEFDVDVKYVANTDFVDFSVDFEKNDIIFNVKSFSEFARIDVSKDFAGNDVFVTLTKSSEDSGLFVYSGKVNKNLFKNENSINVWAIGYGSNNQIWGRMNANFAIDLQPPQVSLIIPDADMDNFVYSDEFEILFDIVDFGGSKLNEIVFYQGNNLIYTSNNLNGYDETFIYAPDLSLNGFSADGNSYLGKVIFKNAQIGNIYNFKLVASDKFGNINETIKSIEVKDGIGIRLLNSDNSKVDFNRFEWITKENAPIIGFRTSKEVEKCMIYPMIDDIWKSVAGEDAKLLSSSVFGNSVENNNFYYDLSQFEHFNLNVIDDKKTNVLIRCIYDGTLYEYTRTLNLIDSLPDYILKSSEGFILNDNPYETKLEVLSVGPYRYVNCSYSIDGSQMGVFGSGFSDSFEKVISFADKNSGIHKLELVCSDMFGTLGPNKVYDFILNKNSQINIESIALFVGSKQILPIDNNFYINILDGFGLEFMTNKKNLGCSYNIGSSSGFLNNFINFFRNLFTNNKIGIQQTSNPYQFKTQNSFNFKDLNNKLTIYCIDDAGKTLSQTYNVKHIKNNVNDFNLIRVGE